MKGRGRRQMRDKIKFWPSGSQSPDLEIRTSERSETHRKLGKPGVDGGFTENWKEKISFQGGIHVVTHAQFLLFTPNAPSFTCPCHLDPSAHKHQGSRGASADARRPNTWRAGKVHPGAPLG